MGFSTIDYLVLLLYLAGITGFGMRFRKAQRSVKDYFVGARTTSWVVICLSIVATETSTLTLIGVPALAYGTFARPEQGGTLTYLQVLIGYIVGRFVIARLFLPSYFRGDLLTAYALLEQRFRDDETGGRRIVSRAPGAGGGRARLCRIARALGRAGLQLSVGRQPLALVDRDRRAADADLHI